MLSRAYNILIDCCVGAPGHGKDVLYGLNATEKMFLIISMTTVKLPGSATNDSHMVMRNTIINTDISIARLF